MGFELFVACCHHGRHATFKRAVIEEIFNRMAINPIRPLTGVKYADGRAEIYGAEQDDVKGVMLAHFYGDTVLANALKLCDRTGSFLFWPAPHGATFSAVTDLAMYDHLPDEFRTHARPPVLVRTAQRLTEIIALGYAEENRARTP